MTKIKLIRFDNGTELTGDDFYRLVDYSVKVKGVLPKIDRTNYCSSLAYPKLWETLIDMLPAPKEKITYRTRWLSSSDRDDMLKKLVEGGHLKTTKQGKRVTYMLTGSHFMVDR